MSVRYACDGCGEMMPEGKQPAKVGSVLARDYCECCQPIAKSYLALVNELHNDIATEWQRRLAEIRARFTTVKLEADEEHPVGIKLLPDTNAIKPKV